MTAQRASAGRVGAKAARARSTGTVRKVSVSLPDELTVAVRQRVGPGGFSGYVSAAVSRQLELDRLAELIAEMETATGPVSADLLREAESAWPGAR